MNVPQEHFSMHVAHGSPYRMLRSPDKIGRAFQAGTPYESPMLEWIYENTEPGQVAIDAGANIGNHTLWMAAVCDLYVHAFEPVIPHVVVANVELNELWDKVTVHPVGLGVTLGEFHHVGKGVLLPGKSKQTTDEVCQVVTLDSVGIKEQIHLIKCDVEGMETSVIHGGLLTIERWRPVILTEEWEKRTTAEIGRLLRPYGYQRIHGFGGKGKAPVGVWRSVP